MSGLKFRELPDGLDFGSLFDPCEDYPYFEAGAEHPFQPAATRFELINASVMADLALLSYLKDAEQIGARLARAGLELVDLLDSGRVHDKLSFFRKLKDRLSGRADTVLMAVRAWRDGELDQSPDDGLVDHSPVHYAIKVWNEYVRSVRSP